MRGGVAVGIISSGARARLVISLRAAKDQGASLDPAPLDLAEVTR